MHVGSRQITQYTFLKGTLQQVSSKEMAWDRELKMTRTDGHKHDDLTSFKDAIGRSGCNMTCNNQFMLSYTYMYGKSY